jgi:hypothetical protein
MTLSLRISAELAHLRSARPGYVKSRRAAGNKKSSEFFIDATGHKSAFSEANGDVSRLLLPGTTLMSLAFPRDETVIGL